MIASPPIAHDGSRWCLSRSQHASRAVLGRRAVESSPIGRLRTCQQRSLQVVAASGIVACVGTLASRRRKFVPLRSPRRFSGGGASEYNELDDANLEDHSDDDDEEDYLSASYVLWEEVTLRLNNLPDDVGVERRTSSIEDAGDGLWASRFFRAGEVVAFYGGHVVSEAELGDGLQEGKVIRTDSGALLDGRLDEEWRRQNPLAMAQFCNHPCGGTFPNVVTAELPMASADSATQRLLAKWIPDFVLNGTEPLVLLLAAERIDEGEEMFLDYKYAAESAPVWYVPVG